MIVNIITTVIFFMLAAIIFSVTGFFFAHVIYRRAIQDKETQLNNAQQEKYKLSEKIECLQQKNSEFSANDQALNVQLSAEKDKLHELKKTFEQQKDTFRNEFQVLSETVLKKRQQELDKKNEILLNPLKKELEVFRDRVNRIHTETQRSHASLETQIKNICAASMTIDQEAKNLTQALKGNSQQRGAWGEMVLEQTLQMCGLIKDTHYSVQDTFHIEGEKKRTDFIIKLPGDKQIIIDSKVTFDYEKVVSAESEQAREKAVKGLIQAIKKYINDLAEKDYLNLPKIHSPGFLLMFMPLEAAYITALQYDKTLFDYGYNKKIVLVSHTTLTPVLYTVSNLWMLEQGNKVAREISEEAGKIYNQVCLVAERFQRLGNTLNTTSKQYNDVVTAIMGRGGLHRKVENFTQISGKITKTMPNLEEQHFNCNVSLLKEIENKNTPSVKGTSNN